MAAPLKKIDVMMTEISQYKVLHHFSQKLYEAFKRAGIESRLLTPAGREKILLSDPPQLTVSFNALSLQSEGDLICDLLKIPHLSILVDPPHWGGVSVMQSPYIILGCDDQYGCTFLESLQYSRHLFIPHAVEIDLKPGPDSERIYDVSLPATYIDFETERNSWADRFPEPVVHLMEETAEEAFTDTDFSFVPIFVSNFYGAARRYHLGDLPSGIFFDALQSLERYVKGRDRGWLAKALRNVSVHVFGNTVSKNSWKSYLGEDHPNIHIHDGIDFDEAIEIMKKSKIVLNPSLKNKQGSHERFFTGTACGALVISSDSPYLREQFIENEEALLYKPTHLEALEPKIQYLLANEEKRRSIVEKARKKVMAHHTWDARIKQFLPQLAEMVQKIRKGKGT